MVVKRREKKKKRLQQRVVLTFVVFLVLVFLFLADKQSIISPGSHRRQLSLGARTHPRSLRLSFSHAFSAPSHNKRATGWEVSDTHADKRLRRQRLEEAGRALDIAPVFSAVSTNEREADNTSRGSTCFPFPTAVLLLPPINDKERLGRDRVKGGWDWGGVG